MKALKQNAFYLGFSLPALVIILFGLLVVSNSSNHIQTIRDDRVITIRSHFFASVTSIPATFKTMDFFISEVKTADFEFTAVGGAWDEISPEGTNVQVQAKFKIHGTWTDWLDLEEEEDKLEAGKKYAMALTNPATALQYKYIMYGDGSKVPLIKNSAWTFLRTGENIYEKKPATRYVADITDLKSLMQSTSDPEVISRSSWGANESYRYLADNNSEPQLIHLDPDFYDKYANELQYSRVVDTDDNGNKYKWPLQYPDKVEKIVIHHTAGVANLDNPKQAIRDIYYYHAVTRGWGDIGYNYIVDQQGNIYEGRYGGEGVIGAHAGAGNHGSIGISFLGNFTQNDVPQEAIVKTGKFIYKKSKIHGIDSQGESEFRGKIMANLIGHRDIMSTDCPGQFLYDKIPMLKILASQNFNLKAKFVKDYDYQDSSEIFYLELKPNEERDLTVKLQNIGKNSWNNKTYLRMQDSGDFTGVISFPGRRGYDLALMQESSVNSGDMGTFKFKVKAEKKPKTVYLNFSPRMNGTEIPDDKIIIPISIEQPVYKYELVSTKFPEKLMKLGEVFTGSITLRNKGNIAWDNSGEGKIFLKGNSFGIIADLQENSVTPDKNGTFNFTYTAKQNTGYYKEIFTPLMEGATWISKQEVSFETIIYEREYDSELLSKSVTKNWEQGASYNLAISLRNIGMNSWTQENLKTAFARSSDLTIGNLKIFPSNVSPGEIGTITFTAKVAKDAVGEKGVLLVTPKMNSEKFVQKPLYFYYKIRDKQLQTSTESSNSGSTIRVKLSFSGDPQITANGSFKVYSGTTLLTTLNFGDAANVSAESGKYRIQAGDSNFLKSDPIRFVPDNNAILKIKNFNRTTGWSSNDNEYRGILEIRDDGGLIAINELPLEDYMKGIAEETNDELTEKIKAVMVAARSYAQYYISSDRKFPGKPYDLDDSPAVSQKYLGYGFEKRAPNVVAAVEATNGEVITYGGKVVKTPFFSQSDGVKTKSAQEVWGWTTTPYLVSVDDSYCKGSTGFAGHGVGMSGCGARGMAEQGKNYREILQHYFTGVEVEALY